MNASHTDGGSAFWTGERVRKYEHEQSLRSEQRQQMLTNIVRIASHFHDHRGFEPRRILDVGCGLGALALLLLERFPEAVAVGVDGSEEMVSGARCHVGSRFPERFLGYVGDFNSDAFWLSQIDEPYNCIVSSSALHYLTDERLGHFFREVSSHLFDKGLFIASIGVLSDEPDIARMTDLFDAEFLHGQLERERGPQEMREVKRKRDKAFARVHPI